MSVADQVNERLAALTAAGTSVWLDQIRRKLIESGELQRPGRRGLAARRDLEPDDLREGDPRLVRLRRRARGAWPSEGKSRAGDLRRARDQGRADRPATSCARSGRRPTTPTATCRSRSTPTSRSTPRGRCARRAALLGARRPAQPDDQDPRHRRGRAGDRAGDLRGHQRQRHAAVLRRRPTSAWPRPTSAASSAASRRARALDVHSVASFFVSRVDTEVDKRLEAIGDTELHGHRRPSPTRAPPTSASRRSSPASAGTGCARPARACSARCGPRPA